MTTHDRVRQQLHALEALLREHQHWRMDEPEAHLFTSTQPFCMDTMEPIEWLQWVLIPRMHALLDSAQPLPEAFAVAPYYEMALAGDSVSGRVAGCGQQTFRLAGAPQLAGSRRKSGGDADRT